MGGSVTTRRSAFSLRPKANRLTSSRLSGRTCVLSSTMIVLPRNPQPTKTSSSVGISTLPRTVRGFTPSLCHPDCQNRNVCRMEHTVGERSSVIDTCSPLTQLLFAIEVYFCRTLFIAPLKLVGPKDPTQFDIRIMAIFLTCQ
jgi:hypothetical protein